MFIVHDFKPAPALPVIFDGDYAAASYAGPDYWGRTFAAYSFAHIAAYKERQRVEQKRVQAIKALDRRTSRR